MKKIIYTLFLAAVVSFAVIGCTDEEIKPRTPETHNNGGEGSIDPLKP